MAWDAWQGGEQLAMYEGHQHESYKLDCCLTPSDGHVVCGSEDGAQHREGMCAFKLQLHRSTEAELESC